MNLILERGLAPGAALPAEPQLTAELGASRNSAREALRALHTLGIVNIRHGHGTVVGEAPVTAVLPGLLFRTRQAARRGAATLADLIQVRRVLEIALIAERAERAEPGFLAGLDALVAGMDSGDLADADRRFHQARYRPVGNEIAVQLIELFWTVYHRVEAELDPPQWVRSEIGHEHQLIVDALRSGDPAAAQQAMTAHFSDIETRASRFTDQVGTDRTAPRGNRTVE